MPNISLQNEVLDTILGGLNVFKSIRWKFIAIFIMLVLIAIVISGVFIIRFFDQYFVNVNESRLDALSQLQLMPVLESYPSLVDHIDEINELVESQKGLGFREEIFVVYHNRILATSKQYVDPQADNSLDFDLLVSGTSGKSEVRIVTIPVEDKSMRVLDKVYPVIHKDKVIGLLYMRYDLKDTDETINRSKVIIFQSTLLALLITITLGFFIARSITGPINDVTAKAYKMARGDFDQYVEVKSDDEIGKLAEMFNHLTRKLKLSLSEISREKNKLEAIVNNMADGLIAISKAKEIVHINTKALEILDANAYDFSKDYTIFTQNLPEQLNFDYLIQKHQSWSGTETMIYSGRTYKLRMEPYFNELSEKEGLILVIQDITEHERLESMRKDFVANVSHELKTPLTSIKSYTETLLDGAGDDEATRNHFLKVIETEADRMSRLVRDLLQLSNYDANHFYFEFKDNDWVELLERILAKLEMQIREKSMDVKVVASKSPLISEFDYDRMAQVVINLISNAIKYTPANGRIRIYMSCENDHILLKVHDTGDGIAKEHLSQIFDRFYRVDKARSREQGGTGLGLSIAKEIIERHNGTITIDSELGAGTTVSVAIPTKIDTPKL